MNPFHFKTISKNLCPIAPFLIFRNFAFCSSQQNILFTSLLVLLITSGCGANIQSADTILFNGKLITMDEDATVAEAVAIKNGKIMKLGDDQEILSLAGDSTRRIDLEGRSVIPGLIEGHAHTIPASQSEYFLEIPEIENVEKTLQWISTEAQRKEPGEWIIHPKFFFTRLEQMRQLTKLELDSVAPENPVFLNGSYGGLINSKALEISGMIGLDHPGILKDDASGEPTGIIRRSAFSLLAIKSPENLSTNQQLEALKELLQQYNRVGITSVISGRGTLEEFKMFETLKESGELTVRVFHNMAFPLDPKTPQVEMREALEKLGYKTGDGDEWVRFGAMKTVIDGGVLTGTAFLREPWGEKAREIFGITDPEYRGELFLTKDDLVGLITVADDTGWNFTAHVTGGGGVDTLLAAFEEVNKSRSITQKRFSIIHGNFYTPAAIRKMSALGIYANMQPAWFFKDTELLFKVLGEDRITTFHPYRSMMDGGIVINGGSDHMVKIDPNTSINPYNPFLAMWSVITRMTERGMVFNKYEAVSRIEALKMYTINNAYASFEEDIKGSLEVGKLADLVVLSEDILSCPDSAIREIESVLTLVNGKVVYEKGNK